VSTLKELIQDVNTILDYNPDLESYRKQVARALNRHYEEISAQYPWLFLQETTTLNVYAKVEGESGVTVDVDVTNRRKVLGVGTSFHADMEGQSITIDGTTRLIVNVASTVILYVDDTYSITEVAGVTEDWSVNFRSYMMPTNCGEVLGIMDRANNRGRITFVDARKEEMHFLDEDVTGEPCISVEHPADFLRAPGIEEPTVVAGGSLIINHTYEYLYTIVSGGMESPPSRTVRFGPISGANKTVRLLGLSDLDFSTGNWSGRRWRFYRRMIDDNSVAGPFYRLDNVSGPSAGSTYDDDGSIDVGYETNIFNEEGFRQRLRFWYTPGTDATLDVRYQSVPRRLQSDDDQPRWPKQYHHLLVYLALQDAGMQHGALQLAQLYERRAKEMLEHMRQRWLTRSDRDYIKQGFDKNITFSRRNARFGIASKS
jgi:hypothetical protein